MKKFGVISVFIAAMAAMSICASAETLEDTGTYEAGVDYEENVQVYTADEATVATNEADEDVTTTEEAAVTDSEKGSPDTGVAGVAAVGATAIIAGGAALLASKRGK